MPAWLAWVPGGFPAGFAGAVGTDAVFYASVVVAGDTQWMTASRGTGGAVVDRPDPPFRIPIDAFAVDPARYGPFLPEAHREAVLGALRRGEAVLGERSAALRRLGVGGSMTFGGVEVVIGAIAPDQVVGWSELLLSRRAGATLGISTPRYLLVLDAGLTLPRFERRVRAYLPAGERLRVDPPGGTPYVRVASGVNPPIVMKHAFGEFSAAPRGGDPAFFTIDPVWYDEHILTRTVPILGRVTCNRAFFPALQGALGEVVDRGLGDLINVYSGCFAARTIGRSSTAPPSNHAYGAAIDIDAPTNGYGDATPAMDPRVVEIFRRWGFVWGGGFVITDGMHFEYGAAPAA